MIHTQHNHLFALFGSRGGGISLFLSNLSFLFEITDTRSWHVHCQSQTLRKTMAWDHHGEHEAAFFLASCLPGGVADLKLNLPSKYFPSFFVHNLCLCFKGYFEGSCLEGYFCSNQRGSLDNTLLLSFLLSFLVSPVTV